jgi:hypothetical protein
LSVRILNELDERQVRLGYVNCVVLTGGRHLDTRSGLRRRFDDFVFHRVYEGTAEAAAFLSQIDEDGKRALERQEQQRNRDRGGKKRNVDVAEVLGRDRRKGRFQYRSHLWILQRCMPSHLGPLAPDRSEVFLEHAKHVGMLAETYALTETGHVLKQLLLQNDPVIMEGRPTSNPLYIGGRLAIRALYIWSLLENDILTPFLLREFAKRRQNDPELLAAATEGLLEAYGRDLRIDSARELKELRGYFERVSQGAKAEAAARGEPTRTKRAGATGLAAFLDKTAGVRRGFKVHRHHARPRLEHYVDLGLLGRRRDSHSAETVYEPLAATHSAVTAWSSILENPRSVRRFLDSGFFASIAAIFDVHVAQSGTQRELLTYFARAFELVGREIGFTPGRTVSFAACLLALEDGLVFEIQTMFDAVHASAKTALGEHLIFSGGSRLDGEFLIRVKPEALQYLQEHRHKTERPTGAH